MRKGEGNMKCKKILACLIAGVMLVGGYLTSGVYQGVDVYAKTFSEPDGNWLVDANGKECKFIAKYSGTDTTAADDNQMGYIEGSTSAIFDGMRTTGLVLRGSASGYAQDGTQIGDYIGVQYKEPIQLQSIRIQTNELFGGSYIEYNTTATLESSGWVRLNEDVTYTGSDTEILVEGLNISGVYGVRLTANTSARVWIKLQEIQINHLTDDGHIYNDIPTSKIESVTAGSAYAQQSTADSDASAAYDGNPASWWHSNWADNTHTGAMEKFWIDYKFTEAINVDGIRTLPRSSGGNGMIASYEVWVSVKDEVSEPTGSGDEYRTSWQKDYTKVCEGTWLNNGDGSTVWKTAKFEAQQVKHVRLVATSTYGNSGADKFVSLTEMRITTPTANVEYAEFLGGSLREREYEDGTATAMRLGYNIPDVDGLTVSTWKWDCGFATTDESGNITSYTFKETVVAPDGQTQPNWTDETEYGDRVSNVVIKGIPSASYNQAIYSQLIITYTNSANEELTVYTKMEARSVAQVVGLILDSGSANPDYAYADTINKVMQGQ